MAEEKQEEELFEESPFPEEAAPVETPPASPTEPPAAEPVQAEPGSKPVEPGFVPVTAMLDERDKRKQLEQELEQYRSQQKQTEQPAPPDIFEDPEGWQAYQAQQFQGALYSQRLDMSYRFAAQSHGQETVDAAMEWGMKRCASDPHFNAMVMNNPDPVGFAVQQYQREQVASQVDLSEFEQFKAWKQAQEAVTPPAINPQVTPPKSIVSAPSAGGAQQIAMGPEATFDEEFK